MPGEINSTIIVIPFYKEALTDSEKLSLNRTLDVLKDHDVVLIKPQSLNVTIDRMVGSDYIGRSIKMESFEDWFFESIKGYNKLLLNTAFYERFTDYQYMLICQLDVYIFEDELEKWTQKGYDYIGSPWTKDSMKKLKASHFKHRLKYIRPLMKIHKMLFDKKDYLIGNGGFSLRNIRKSLTVLRYLPKYAKKWKGNEDVFWSMLVPVFAPFFKVPNLKQALGFGFETEPEYFYEMNDKQLPFGCHAWEKHDPGFWKKHIKQKNSSSKGELYGILRKEPPAIR